MDTNRDAGGAAAVPPVDRTRTPAGSHAGKPAVTPP